MRASLGEMVGLLRAGGAQVHAEPVGDTEILGPDVVIDSRLATPGSIFIAFPGERVDGHDYVEAAAQNGARAAIVTRIVEGLTTPIAQIVVDDAREALTALGRAVVARAHDLTSIAVTGSAGKTSTKDLLAHVLRADGETIAPRGSFNNEVGTPLTAVQVGPTTRYLVSEMGARAAGDVAYLCSIVPPQIALITNIGSAHLGEFGSREAIAAAKGEIFQALPADGWAVVNADDPYVVRAAASTPARVLAVTTMRADDLPLRADRVVQVSDITSDELGRHRFTLTLTSPAGGSAEQADVSLASIGAHQVMNAALAAGAAIAAGMSLAVVAHALSEPIALSPWRMEVHEIGGAVVINDAYNANPESMAAALRALAQIAERRRQAGRPVRTIAVLGDMLELGEDAEQLHYAVGQLAAELGINEIMAVGNWADHIVAGARTGQTRAAVFGVEQVADALEKAEGDVIMVKASRGLRLERIAEAACQEAHR